MGWWAEPTLRGLTYPKSASFGETRAALIGFVRGDSRGPNRLRSGNPRRADSPCEVPRGRRRPNCQRAERSARNLRDASRGIFLRADSLPKDSTRPRAVTKIKPGARGRCRHMTHPPLALLPANGSHTSESSARDVSDTRRISRFRPQCLRSDRFSLPTDSTRPREASRRGAPKGGFRERSPQPPSRTIERKRSDEQGIARNLQFRGNSTCSRD